MVSLHLQISRRFLAAVADDVVADLGTLIEAAQAGLLDGRDMDEHILAAAVGLNKSEPLLRIEPLHCARRHVRTPRFEISGDNPRSIEGRAASEKARLDGTCGSAVAAPVR
jgi:hypothetical protein